MAFILSVIFLIPAAIRDIRCRQIPVWLFVILIPVGIFLHWHEKTLLSWDTLLGAASGALFFPVSMLYRKGFGVGDAWLLFVYLFLNGLSEGIPAVILSFFCTGVTGGILLLFRKIKKRDGLPFAPFLLSGALINQALIYLFGG